MTPLAVRKAASLFQQNHPNASLIEAFIQGYLSASVTVPTVSTVSDNDEQLFLHVWNLYQRKDNKQSALKAWRKLTPEEKERVFRHVPAYVQAHSEKQFRPMLATYLNQKRFNDEEIISNAQRPSEQQQRFSAYAEAINSLNPTV